MLLLSCAFSLSLSLYLNLVEQNEHTYTNKPIGKSKKISLSLFRKEVLCHQEIAGDTAR